MTTSSPSDRRRSRRSGVRARAPSRYLKKELVRKPSVEPAHRLRRIIRHLRKDDEAQVRALIKQLDADDYASREQATAELIRHVRVEPDFRALLREALRASSPEVRRRVLKVLEGTEAKR